MIVIFSLVEGIEVGKICVKYKSVDIGVVKVVGFMEDWFGVVVLIELMYDGKVFVVLDICFWVVCLCVVVGSIFGFGILFFGVYIGVDGGCL